MHHFIAAILISLVAVRAVAATCPIGSSLAPRTDFGGEGELQAFHQSLGDAIKQRDADSLMPLLSPEISGSFGAAEPGRVGFVKSWRLDRPDAKDSDLWNKLADSLARGGQTDASGNFCFPLVASSAWPAVCDPAHTGVLVGTDIRVRTKPDRSAKIVRRASHEIVGLVPDRDPKGWRYVRLANHQAGFVPAEFVAQPTGFRGCFSKQKDRVLLTMFIAGDRGVGN